jgi:predicted transcriptional regulator of viral defense system
MTLLEALRAIAAMDAPVFTTRDAAARLRVPNGHASVSLARLAAAGQLIRLRRGTWALPNCVDPLALPEYLTSPFPAYVSLQSALYLHGMISQVPSMTYAVSLARTRQFRTPLGTVSLHHVQPGFFFGYEDAGRGSGRLATPEKALVDFLYLTPARSRLFRALPELEWPTRFRVRAARAIVTRITSSRRRTLVARKLEELLETRPAWRSVTATPSAPAPASGAP